MKRKSLTNKQQDFLDFIEWYYGEYDSWPTYEAITEEFRYKSPYSVTQNYDALIEKGYLTRDSRGGYQFPNQENNLYLIVDGVITAGEMQDMIADSLLQPITLENLFGKSQFDIITLKVDGDSMINFAIHSGDYVFLRKTTSIKDSDYKKGFIGAINYRNVTTLKKVQKIGNVIRLIPGNETYPVITIEPGDQESIEIVGRYAGHLHIDV